MLGSARLPAGLRAALPAALVAGLAVALIGAAGGVAGAVAVGPAVAPAVKSTGSAGYRVAFKAATSGSVQLHVPSETCDSKASGVLAGIVDTNKMTVSVFAQCNKGSTTLQTGVFVWLFGHSKSAAAAAGDAVTVSFSVSGTSVTATVADSTAGTTTSLTATGALTSPLNYGVHFLAEPGIRQVTPGPFGLVTFSGATLNGAAISGQSPVVTTWVGSSGQVLVSTSSLSSAGAFTTTRA